MKREDAIREAKRATEEKLRLLREVANRHADRQNGGARTTSNLSRLWVLGILN